GKHGKGIVPVAGEPLGSADAYGDDRVFVHIQQKDSPEAGFATEMTELAKAGHPVFTVDSEGPADLGRIMFFSEFATAVAGWVLGINPFDQPNVQEAKDATKRVLESGGADPDDGDVADVVRSAPPSYVAIMGYVQPTPEFDAAVRELRAVLRDAT